MRTLIQNSVQIFLTKKYNEKLLYLTFSYLLNVYIIKANFNDHFNTRKKIKFREK